MSTERQDLFQHAFEHSAIGMALTSLDGRFIDANEALARIVGYTKAELEAMSFQDITHPDDLDIDLHLADELVKGEIPFYNLEKRYIHRNGHSVWAMLTCSLVRHESGQPELFIAQIQDISVRKRAEADREAFFDLAPDMLAITGRMGYLEKVNDAWTQTLGWSGHELVSRPFLEFVHPEDRSRTSAETHAVYQGRPLKGFRNRYRHKSGDYRWLEWNTRVAGNGDLYCVVRDVTRQQDIQERLRVQGDALRAASNGILITDPNLPDSPIVYCNPAFERITGYAQIEVLGRNCQFLHGSDREQGALKVLNEAMAAGKESQVVLRNYRKNGQLFYNELLMAPVRDKDGRLLNYVGIIEDITERVRAQEELRNREVHLRQITSRIPALIFQWYSRSNGAQGYNYISSRCDEMFGVPAAALMADWTRTPVHPDDMAIFANSVRDAVANHAEWSFEGRLLRPDGSVRWIKCTSSPTQISNKEIAFTGIVLDVTEEHEAQEHRHANEERIRQFIDNANEAFVGMDQDGRITEWNRQAEKTFGWTEREALGLNAVDLIVAGHARAEHHERMAQFVRQGSLSGASNRTELPALRRDGTILTVEMTIGANKQGDRYHFHAFLHDISDRKQLERKLEQERQLLNAILETIDVGVKVCDATGTIMLANRALRELISIDDARGLSLEEWAVTSGLYGTHASKLQEPALALALKGESVQNLELTIEREDRRRHVIVNARTLRDNSGQVNGAVAAVQDITELKRTTEQLRESTDRLRTIADSLPVLISYIDKDSRFRFTNETYRSWLGINPQALIGMTASEALPTHMVEATETHFRKALAGKPVQFEMTSEALDVRRYLETSYIPHIKDGRVEGVYALTIDISSRKAVEQQLNQLARYDALTGLPNRRHFEEKLEEALARNARTGQVLSLMYVDVDFFKNINDGYGHAGGDDVLIEIASRLKHSIRGTDTVARLGGDEFVIILEGLSGAAQAEAQAIADKLIVAVREPVSAQGQALRVSVSIGIAVSTGSEHASAVCLRADGALYQAKDAGRDCFRSG
ncbi:PAS domain S-box protein [Herbaspirillum sp. GCM10030257]|uniref:PAS domain S-box protein n=1 Tax=Herbaspirillum sp. GCM10030257 TaxID=3273393 RepID=UPI003615D84C